MAKIILLNKPFNVLSQFTDENGRMTLKHYLPSHPGFHPAGRLDYDSEGLLLLTDNGPLQHRISDPKHKLQKTYFAQVEGVITDNAIKMLQEGVTLKDGKTKPAKARIITEPEIWPRDPPIRQRKNIPTSWISLSITEGKNRQVRRMTAHVGFPTLRLIRMSIGNWSLDKLLPGEFTELEAQLPTRATSGKPSSTSTRNNNKKPKNTRSHAGRTPRR